MELLIFLSRLVTFTVRFELLMIRSERIVFLTAIFAFLSISGISQTGNASCLGSLFSPDTSVVNSYLRTHGINSICPQSNHTLLVTAILNNSPRLTKYLLEKGASPDAQSQGKTPLMHAAFKGKLHIPRMLIQAGANPNATDSAGNTALMYAAQNNNTRLARYLLRHGAWLNHTNNEHLSAIDIANYNLYSRTSEFLANYYRQHLPNWTDGPYVRFQGKKKINLYYLVYDSLTRKAFLREQTVPFTSLPMKIKGMGNDTATYTVYPPTEPQSDTFSGVEKIFVMGDVHGGYTGMISLLKANNIINNDLSWNFGNGHLVFQGDIFDRGDKVTESLWFIYHLARQASEAGGNVHYLLGNHEIMMLRKDYRYLPSKYYYLNDKVRKDYSSHFGKNTLFGQWIRSLNSVLIINQYMFVHAGISPEVFSQKLTPSEMNAIVRAYLAKKPEKKDHNLEKLLTGNIGIFWYRGLVEKNHAYPMADPAFVDSLTKHYHVKTIFVGHTNVPRITSLYNGKVIAVDVPYYTFKAEPEAVLIENGKIFRVSANGQRTPLF